MFRFDVSREWIYQNWDRKSTGLGDPELFGIRVTLITGTQRTDLAGSLTYLFDAQGKVRAHFVPRPDGRHDAAGAISDADATSSSGWKARRRAVVSGSQRQ